MSRDGKGDVGKAAGAAGKREGALAPALGALNTVEMGV